MPDLAELERRILRLESIDAIKRTKYRYWRCLDLKRWDELGEVFAADALVDYGTGLELRGVEAILDFLRRSLGGATRTVHHGHHDDIELTSPTTAKASWALYNLLY